MPDVTPDADDRSQPTEQPAFDGYLPAGPQPSRTPGRVERFLARHLRRRGRLRRVLVPKYR
jgi:hypothetical protein